MTRVLFRLTPSFTGENFGGDFNGCCYFRTNIEHNSPKYTHHSTQITKECDYSNKIMLNSGVSRIFLSYSARSSQRRAPCDQYCRDTIDSPSTKHAVLTKLNCYNILMSDIDRNTIRMFQDRVCSRYQHVFTYRRRSLRQNRTLLIIKSRYLMDMSPLYHVVG